MHVKSIVTGIAAVVLTVTPTLATAQTAAPAHIAPADESVEGSELRDNFDDNLATIVTLLGVGLVTYLILRKLLKKDKDDRNVGPGPVSP